MQERLLRMIKARHALTIWFMPCCDQLGQTLALLSLFLLDICDEMQGEVLKMIAEEEKSEKRE